MRKNNKIRDIKETASDAVEIMRMISNPGVLDSLNKLKDTTIVVNEIIRNIQTPEMVKNIENFRLISENLTETSTEIQDTVQEIKESGVIDETTETIKSVKEKINSIIDDGNNLNSKNIRDVTVTSKEMLLSIKELVNELTLTVVHTKKSGFIGNLHETVQYASNSYKTITS